MSIEDGAVQWKWQGSGPDFEVEGRGPFIWSAYDEDVLIGKGKAKTKLGLLISIARFKHQVRKGER